MKKYLASIILLLPTLTIGKILDPVPGISHAIEPHFIGFNQNFMGQTDPWDDRLIAQLAASQAATFRYPAGTVGSYWNWRTGRVDESLNPAEVMDWIRPHVVGGERAGQGRYTLENLKRAADATGIVPVFMLGMAVHDLYEQVSLLKYAESIGLPVLYIELGNEIIFQGAEPLLEKKFPDAETYGRVASQWIEALQKAFPRAKIAACGTFVGSAQQSERRRTWNTRMMATLRGTDILTTHLYAGEIVRTERERAGLTEVQAQQALTATERAERATGPITAESAAATIGLIYSVWDKLLAMSIVPDGKQLWVTEWSTGGAGGGGSQWQTSLATAALLDAFLRTNVTLTNHHTMGTAFGRGGTPERGGGTAPDAGLPRNPGNSANLSTEPNATGMILREFSRATRGHTQATELVFPGGEVITAKSGRTYATVVGWAFGSASDPKRSVVLLNLGANPIEVSRSGLPVGAKTFRQFSAAPADSPPEAPTANGTLEAPVLTLPAFSLTILE